MDSGALHGLRHSTPWQVSWPLFNVLQQVGLFWVKVMSWLCHPWDGDSVSRPFSRPPAHPIQPGELLRGRGEAGRGSELPLRVPHAEVQFFSLSPPEETGRGQV